MVRVERLLLAAADRLGVAQHAQREEGLEEAQLVLIDADRIEGAHIEGAYLDILDARRGAAPWSGRSPELAIRLGRMKL